MTILHAPFVAPLLAFGVSALSLFVILAMGMPTWALPS